MMKILAWPLGAIVALFLSLATDAKSQNLPGISLSILASKLTPTGPGTITVGDSGSGFYGYAQGSFGAISGAFSTQILSAAWDSTGSTVIITTSFPGTLTIGGGTYPLSFVSLGTYQYNGAGLGSSYPTSGTIGYTIP